MKSKRVVPFLGLLFIAPFLAAFGDASHNYYVNYRDFKSSYVALNSSNDSMNSYRITYENTGDYYLNDYSFMYGENKCEIMRENEPFNMPSIIVAPGKKETFYIELSKETKIEDFVKSKSAYTTIDENVKLEKVSNLRLGNHNSYENYDTALVDCDITGLDNDYVYALFLNVSYQGREYNVHCDSWENSSFTMRINKNTCIDDLKVNNIFAFKYAPNGSGSFSFKKLALVLLLIITAPITAIVLIKIVIVAIAVISVRIKEKKKTKQ